MTTFQYLLLTAHFNEKIKKTNVKSMEVEGCNILLKYCDFCKLNSILGLVMLSVFHIW